MGNTVNNFSGNVEHVQLGGQAFYDESKFFMFSPDNAEAGTVRKYRSRGVGQQMADGTFDFVAKPALRSKSTLIKKLAHGRLSATTDGAIQLTLKVYKNEGLDIKKTIMNEAREAAE
jgi:hypothetical protein